MNAQVTLIQILDDKVFYGIDEEIVMGYDTLTYDKFDEFVIRITADMTRYFDSTATHLGELVIYQVRAVCYKEKDILKFVENGGTDFIVIDTRGHSAFHNLIIGKILP